MTRDSFEMNPNRPARGNSFFKTDPQVQLRTALRTNDFTTFKKLVSYGTADLEHVYQYPDYKTCLEMAVTEPNKQEFVKLLLQHEVEVNKINESHGAAPIHFAVESGNIEALKALLEDDRIDVNIKSKGNTALLLAIKQMEDVDDERESKLATFEDMIELLLKAGCNASSPDSKGVTPVYSAAKQGLERVITLILDYAKNSVDLDAYKDRRNRTARYYLKEAFPHLLAKFDSTAEPADVIDNDKLFSYLNRHEDDNFVRDFNKIVKQTDVLRSALTANDGMNTLLQAATEKGLKKSVKTLLDAGADPNATFSGNPSRPISFACQNGFTEILKLFIDHQSTLFDPISGETLLQICIRGMRSFSKHPQADHKGCIHLLLKHPKINIDVNHPDIKNNTALHYAARNGDNEIVLELLRRGGCVGLRNKFNEPPLADIGAKTLETFLDECITTNGERPSDDDYEIHMKYSFLVYPNNSLENELCKMPLMNDSNNTNNNGGGKYDAVLAPETDALLYMTANEDLRPLLKHPVITSFLYLKWQRISCLFLANITFYSLLWLSLLLYIIMGYGVERKQSDAIEALNVVTHVGAIIGLILLIVRELFQFLVSPIRYLQSFENLMEIALIIVTGWIVCYDNVQESTKQQLSAVAILLSSAELVLLIGQFPTLSTNIVMLKTVSWNFFKFLLWYCILIIAFAFSFYTLFRKTVHDDQTPPDPNETKEGEEEDFFEDPFRSLFKTIVMLTGEFDASSIQFSTFPVTSHIIFIVFVFMIPIVLFNLLNGLAVSDTQEIRANAELVGHISRVKLISYFESVLIGNSNGSTSKGWSCLPQYLNKLHVIHPNMLCIKPFAKRISLFPHFLPRYKIIVKPNLDNKVEIPNLDTVGKIGDDYEDIENGGCCFERCQDYRLDRRIVKNAKLVISKKTQVSELDELNTEVSSIKSKLDNIESLLKKLADQEKL